VIKIITLAVILLAVLPLCVFTELLGQQARRSPVASAWYLCLAATWLACIPVAYVGLVIGLSYLERSVGFSEWLFYPLLLLTGPVGGSVGPGLIWLYLRCRRTHDPDYEED
jgi:hypothetical protein